MNNVWGWLQPAPDRGTKRRSQDRTLALLLSNVVFGAIVYLCFKAKMQHGVASNVAQTFAFFEVLAVLVYLLNEFAPRKPGMLFLRLFGHDADSPDDSLTENTINGFSFPLPLTVILNAYAIGYLTYKTGGPSNSPYAQVLVAMLIIGEQTKTIAHPDHAGHLFRIVSASIKEFRVFLVVGTLFYGGLLYYQWRHPVDVTTAPAGLTVGVTALMFLVGTVANYLSKSAQYRAHMYIDEIPDLPGSQTPDGGSSQPDAALSASAHESGSDT